MQPNHSSELHQAFAVLRAAVDDLYEGGRRPVGAALKPELVRRTYGGFSEARLGFPSFGTFARAAQEAGYVDVHRSATDPDFEAVPPGAQPRGPAAVSRVREAPQTAPDDKGRFIRKDLWTTFVDWTPGMSRLFDVEKGRASMFPAEPAPLEPENVATLRESARTNPDHYRQIPEIGMHGQIEWMREFVEAQPSGHYRPVLEYALQSERPFREFHQAVRREPPINDAWQEFRKERVADRIRAWLQSEGLDVPIYASPANGASVSTPMPTPDQRPARVRAEVDDIRRQMHEVIERMSTADLLRLSIPLEYVLKD